LANHRKAIRTEIAASAERYRAEQVEGLAAVFERYGSAPPALSPVACSVLMTAVSRFLVIEEEALGMTTGHAATVAVVEDLIWRLEGERRDPVTT
jgi:hypothetical protein